MKRLAAVALALGVLAPSSMVGAQPAGRVYRIVILWHPRLPSPPPPSPATDAFREALQQLGWVEGRSVVIERRSTDVEHLPQLAAEVVREKVDLIVTTTSVGALAAKNATSTIPIVMAVSADPIGGGVAGSIARPGGNITGLTLLTPEITAKRLQLLKEVVPRLGHVAAVHPGPATFPIVARWITENQTGAAALGLKLDVVEVEGADRWDAAFGLLKRDGVGGAVLIEGPRYLTQAPHITAAALKHGVATMFPFADQVEAGGLMSYGANPVEMFRRAGSLADRILRGARPADLPIEQPTKFDLVVNLKTATALGLKVPESVLLRATRVIE